MLAINVAKYLQVKQVSKKRFFFLVSGIYLKIKLYGIIKNFFVWTSGALLWTLHFPQYGGFWCAHNITANISVIQRNLQAVCPRKILLPAISVRILSRRRFDSLHCIPWRKQQRVFEVKLLHRRFSKQCIFQALDPERPPSLFATNADMVIGIVV